jgi:hypothetical protein
MVKPLPCPFCGSEPELFPEDPEREGDAWGEVACVNEDCPAQPRVKDGEGACDYRGSDAYKAAAVARWNKRWN